MKVEIRPAFDRCFRQAEKPLQNAVRKMILQLLEKDVPQLMRHPGLNFEKIHGMLDPLSGRQIYSLRVTGSARAISCLISGPAIVLVSLHSRHDEAYSK
jgi:hypothetical protein